MQSDHQIMIAVRDGDTGRLGILFDRYAAQLVNYFLRLTGDRPASEDMVQEVFLRILKYRHTYRGEGSFTAWMFSIARNVRVDMHRKRKNITDTVELDDNLPSGDMSPHEYSERENEKELVHKALDMLDEDKREVLILNRFKEMSCDEIGSILGISAGAVRVRICRAMKDLTARYHELTQGTRYELQ